MQLFAWAGLKRSAQLNLRLGIVLSFVAGAANAGGFLAFGQYTSHMTGMVSAIADNWVLGQLTLVLTSLGSILAFLLGAMTTAWLVNWAQRRRLHSAFALPLLLESILLLIFGLFGAAINHVALIFIPLTIVHLCYLMGLQNALITKISRSEIRTTHVTGLLTDMGIELGKLLYVNRLAHAPHVLADRNRLRMHALLLASFLVGGILGALGFRFWGYITTVPLASLLLLFAAPPLWDDLCPRLLRRKSQ
jgi:uncharacterized membrane protein YoaK (UPF0700 family)